MKKNDLHSSMVRLETLVDCDCLIDIEKFTFQYG